MWTERPRAFKDGLVVSTAISLAVVAILSLWNAGGAAKQPVAQCQEVVVIVERRGDILARCPAGTYLDLADGENVVCRCGTNRQPTLDVEPDVIPSTPEELPNAEPKPPSDDGGTWL